MDFLSSGVDIVLPFLAFLHDYVVPFLVAITVLVFVHEMGHYLVARWCGVRVEVFSVGFGSEIYGWTRFARTRWKLSWIPVGGYVKMFGEMLPPAAGEARDEDRLSPEEERVSFHTKFALAPRGKSCSRAPSPTSCLPWSSLPASSRPSASVRRRRTSPR